MKTRKHTREIFLPASAEKVFQLLITPSAIKIWWNASRAIVHPKSGGIWIATWGENEDKPEYITSATMSVFDPPRGIVMTNYDYFSKDGLLPFNASFETEFLIIPQFNGSVLRVTQSGFPADSIADDFYAACETGWKTTLESIAAFVRKDHP
ncbi:MAG: SRPBCC domain-containing protein [Ignavibacteriales bacterium]|nr:SRPBCC domain-containing protein [Ignavibacteriales bacterium]